MESVEILWKEILRFPKILNQENDVPLQCDIYPEILCESVVRVVSILDNKKCVAA